VIVFALAVAWGVFACAAALGLERRVAVTRRARAMAPRSRTRRRHGIGPAVATLAARPPMQMVARVAGAPIRRRRTRRRDDAVMAELPVAVDLVGVAVGAGCTPYQAVELSARWSPPRLRRVLDGVVRSTALGVSFDAALQRAADGTPSVRRLTETLRASARLGTPAAPTLTRLAQEVRADVRRRAEARARTVPVRLLFPLVFCVLPAFALLTVVPVLLDGIAF
jgi:tight adherence protein C